MTERTTFDGVRDPQGQTEDQQPSGPTVRDKRRIDPETYEVREPQATAAPAPGAPDGETPEVASEGPTESAEVTELKASLADRTSDLQRIQAEYVNYKRRVDRDRDVARAGGVESVLRELLTVLDNVKSARQHDELSPGFKAVADELERVTTKHGLTSFGEAGDAFDPHVHDALMHTQAPQGTELEGPTCVQILQPGYQIGDRVIRPARVAVADPA
ncbi:MAG: nucleotide exchange factor GrpE [Propionibacteriaceae bacterium]